MQWESGRTRRTLLQVVRESKEKQTRSGVLSRVLFVNIIRLKLQGTYIVETYAQILLTRILTPFQSTNLSDCFQICKLVRPPTKTYCARYPSLYSSQGSETALLTVRIHSTFGMRWGGQWP